MCLQADLVARSDCFKFLKTPRLSSLISWFGNVPGSKNKQKIFLGDSLFCGLNKSHEVNTQTDGTSSIVKCCCRKKQKYRICFFVVNKRHKGKQPGFESFSRAIPSSSSSSLSFFLPSFRIYCLFGQVNCFQQFMYHVQILCLIFIFSFIFHLTYS